MDLETSTKIINEYGAVLEKKAESGMVVAPTSMLPYPKSDIKAAIRHVLSSPGARLTKETKRQLENGYVLLADFVEDQDAQIANRFDEWCATHSAAPLDQLKEALRPSPPAGDRAVEITGRVHRDCEVLLKEVEALRKIVTYRDDPKGRFCQLRLNSGERMLISIAQTGVKISKLGLGGLIPTKTIWESNDVPGMVELFADEDEPDRTLVDSIIAKIGCCQSLDEVKHELQRSLERS